MNETIKKIYSKIEQYETIIIHRHRSPDLDCVGSQMALKEMLKLNFPTKKVLATGIDGYDDFNYIGAIDFVTNDAYNNALVIIVDTANKARIEEKSFSLGTEIIKIDHHPDIEEERYGDLNYVDTKYSSTCELLYYLAQDFKDINPEFKIDETIAKYLFYGIYGDTGGFIYPNTTSSTFNCIANLVSYDFDYEQTVADLRVYNLETMQIVGWCYQNIEVKDGVGYLVFDKAFQKEFGVTPAKLSFIVNFMGIIKELKTWCVFNEHDNFIRVNIRSRRDYNISNVAMKFEGGGHKNASGAMIKSWSQKEDVLQALHDVVQDNL